MPTSRKRKNRYQGKGAKERARKMRRLTERIRIAQRDPGEALLLGAVARGLARGAADSQVQDALAAFEGRPSHLAGTISGRTPSELELQSVQPIKRRDTFHKHASGCRCEGCTVR